MMQRMVTKLEALFKGGELFFVMMCLKVQDWGYHVPSDNMGLNIFLNVGPSPQCVNTCTWATS